jgi:hypothetical protein
MVMVMLGSKESSHYFFSNGENLRHHPKIKIKPIHIYRNFLYYTGRNKNKIARKNFTCIDADHCWLSITKVQVILYSYYSSLQPSTTIDYHRIYSMCFLLSKVIEESIQYEVSKGKVYTYKDIQEVNIIISRFVIGYTLYYTILLVCTSTKTA